MRGRAQQGVTWVVYMKIISAPYPTFTAVIHKVVSPMPWLGTFLPPYLCTSSSFGLECPSLPSRSRLTEAPRQSQGHIASPLYFTSVSASPQLSGSARIHCTQNSLLPISHLISMPCTYRPMHRKHAGRAPTKPYGALTVFGW